MPAVCKPYETADAADRAVAALLSAGVDGDHVRVLMAAHLHDARQEEEGGFAGAIGPDATLGGFAASVGGREAPRGGFAGAVGDAPDGIFGNVDRDVVVAHADGGEQVRAAGHHQLVGLLEDAGLDRTTAEADVRALHDGRVLVLVRLADRPAEELRAVLDGVVAAA